MKYRVDTTGLRAFRKAKKVTEEEILKGKEKYQKKLTKIKNTLPWWIPK